MRLMLAPLVKNLNGKKQQMKIFNLLHPIDPTDSFKKVKLKHVFTNWKFHFCLFHLFECCERSAA